MTQEKNTPVALLPCPCCASDLTLHDTDWCEPIEYFGRCDTCGLHFPGSIDREKAIANANRRPTTPPPALEGDSRTPRDAPSDEYSRWMLKAQRIFHEVADANERGVNHPHELGDPSKFELACRVIVLERELIEQRMHATNAREPDTRGEADTLAGMRSEIERLREALTKAAEQFEFYAKEHRGKALRFHMNWDARSTEQENQFNAASAKAETNERFAHLCRAALQTQERTNG